MYKHDDTCLYRFCPFFVICNLSWRGILLQDWLGKLRMKGRKSTIIAFVLLMVVDFDAVTYL